mmetsp:Transcript_5372/g.6614  ORF Transcript_5372/g.6614 Transcript_5372/m.6614 type:complete len:84 (-) Transcript_5372:1711-1962(-)
MFHMLGVPFPIFFFLPGLEGPLLHFLVINLAILVDPCLDPLLRLIAHSCCLRISFVGDFLRFAHNILLAAFDIFDELKRDSVE